MDKKTVLIASGLFLSFLLGYGLGKAAAPQTSPQNTKTQIIQELRTKLNSKAKKGLIPFGLSTGKTKAAQTSLSGKIAKINPEKNLIEIKIDNPYRGGDLFAYIQEPDYYQKQIIVGNDTEIVKLKPKEMKEMPKPGEINPEEFSPFEEIKLSLKDLKEGESVRVESQAEFKLEENKPIKAKKITVR